MKRTLSGWKEHHQITCENIEAVTGMIKGKMLSVLLAQDFAAYGKALKETVEVLDETAKLFAEKVEQVV